MKKIIPLLLLCFGSLISKAQCNMFMYGVVNNVICNGTNTGSYQIDTSLLAGIAPYTFTSTPAATYSASGLVSNLVAGNYTIVAADAAGCTVSTMITVSQPPSPLILNNSQLISVMPTCNNSCDGSITASATGGVTPYVYTISPLSSGSTNGQFNFLCPGTYTIVVTDAVGCSASVVEYLSPANFMFVNATLTNPTSCGICDGEIALNVIGGVPPFSYSLNSQPASNTGTFSNLCAGAYNYFVTDAFGCMEFGYTSLNTGNLSLSAISSTNPTCNGGCNGVMVFQASGGGGSYTYAISPSSGIIQTTPGLFTNVCAGAYTVTATDQNGCSAMTTMFLSQPPALSMATVSDTIVCGQGDYINAYAYGGVTPYSFNLAPVSLSNSNGQFNFPLAATTYTVTVIDAMGCTITTVVNPVVISNALLGVTATSIPYNESCYYASDGSIDLTISPSSSGLSFAWDSGDITEDIFNAHSGTYHVVISDVNGNCITHSETVSSNGINCGSASGKIIYDVNNSCIEDVGDFAVSNRHVQLGGGALAITNNQGIFYFSNIGLVTHAISQTLNTPFLANACVQPTSFTLNSSTTSLTGLNFYDSLMSYVDAGVYMLNSGIVTGFNGSYYLYAHNSSNTAVNVNVSFVLNNLLTYSGASLTPNSLNPTPSGDSLTWALTLPPLSFGTMIQIDFYTPTSVVAGMPILSRARVATTSATDVNSANNLYEYTAICTSSFDPNVKNVNPVGEGPNGNITLQDKVLDYTVHFQNTGTSAAHRVIILDTLSSRVDISTLEVMAFSHNYKIEILGTNVVKFTFDNIMLPDSNSNEPESHGFISYRIHQSPLNQLGQQIKNKASIYFDFNAPVVTNTTVNTLVAPNSITQVEKQHLSFDLYPNPAKNQCNLSLVAQESGAMQVQFINAIGQVVRTQIVNVHVGENQISLNVQGIASGLYNVRIQQGEWQGAKNLIVK